MRPVQRGPVPVKNGQPVVFHDYKLARDPLMERIGEYCSYCEIPLPSGADVEHIQPKDLYPALERAWSNFLLGCSSCNSIKGNADVQPASVFLPDRDNTFRAVQYSQDRAPQSAPGLNSSDTAMARALLNLVGVDRHPGPGHRKPPPRDLRWLMRDRVWRLALRAREELDAIPATDPAFRKIYAEQIVETALGRGFFSVWMTVFATHSSMRRRLIQAFPGTAGDCFDAAANPVPRPGGKI